MVVVCSLSSGNRTQSFPSEKESGQPSLVRFVMAGHSFLAARCGIKLASLLARIH
jgi:hypothetical protein